MDVGGELIRVPTEQWVSHVGIDAAELACQGGDHQVVFEIVAGQRGVIGLDVELEMVEQTELAEEVQHRGRVEVVLVLGGLLGLGFDEELSVKPIAFAYSTAMWRKRAICSRSRRMSVFRMVS